MSPGRSSGARNCSVQARNASPLIGPSSMSGATIPSWRNPARNVVVFQCPCGAEPTRRVPRRLRPQAAAIEPRHVRLGPGLIEEEQPPHIQLGLPGDPLPPGFGDIGAALLGRPERLFLRVSLSCLSVFQTVVSPATTPCRSEEHTSELQSRQYLVCRLLLEKKKKDNDQNIISEHNQKSMSMK